VAERELPEVHRAVVDRLVGDLRPVRRLKPPGIRLLLWLPVQLVVLAWVIVFHLRGDAAGALARPPFLLEVAALAAAGVVAAALALRGAVPGDEPSSREAAAAIALALGATLLLLLEPAHGTPPASTFVAHGVPCAVLTAALAALPWLLLLVALARGAPLHGARAAAWAATAALLVAGALMRLACPLDERLHLLVWHAGPTVPALLLSAAVGWSLLALRARSSEHEVSSPRGGP
jgi:hypothetical protein